MCKRHFISILEISQALFLPIPPHTKVAFIQHYLSILFILSRFEVITISVQSLLYIHHIYSIGFISVYLDLFM